MKDVLVIIFKFAILFQVYQETRSYDQCITPHGKPGECRGIELCDSLTKVLKKNHRSEEENLILRKSQCGHSSSSYLVCCDLESIVTTRRPQTSTVSKRQVQKQLPKVSDGICGKPYKNVYNRIIGGEEANLGEFPWMTVLLYRKNNRKIFGCGGSLITDQHVLSAAHCVVKEARPPKWELEEVRLGELDKTTNPDCREIDKIYTCAFESFEVRIAKMFSHERYNSTDPLKVHDISILKLQNSVAFNEFVRPICLDWPVNEDTGALTIIGFGRTESSKPSDYLLKAEVDTVNHNECVTKYGIHGRSITGAQLCANRFTTDTCNGDSGSPLMKLVEASQPYWVLVGVTSFGPSQCGSPDYPGIYTKIDPYYVWIQSKIKLNSPRKEMMIKLKEPQRGFFSDLMKLLRIEF